MNFDNYAPTVIPLIRNTENGLTTVYAPAIWTAGEGPIGISRGGRVIECATREEAEQTAAQFLEDNKS